MRGSPTPTPKELLKNMTGAEKTLWYRLRARRLNGYKFRRQHRLGLYVVDFVCTERRLIIEVDGGQHSERAGYDEERTAWLNRQGFKVLRFWDNDVLEEVDAVLETIVAALS